MSEQKRILLLIFIMTVIALTVSGISIILLYQTAMKEQRARLVETAQSQARLLEAIARHNSLYEIDYPGGPEAATLSQIRDAHQHYVGFGETGEFTLANREDDQMVFLLNHRHFDLDQPQPVPFASELAEPMRRSLSGQSGTVMGLDYRGEMVLAAYEPVSELDWGIVAKIDLAEIRQPFLYAGLIAGFVAIVVVLFGAGLFIYITNPLLQQLRFQSQLLDSVRESVVATDMMGNVIYWGKGAEMLYGYDADEVVGKPITFIVESNETQEELERVKQVNETGFWHGEYVQKRKDGSSFWADTFISLVTDEHGRPSGMIGIDHDITERKFAEKSLEEALIITQQHEREFASLLEASRAVLEYQEFEPAARAIFEACKSLIGATCGYVVLLSPDGKENEVVFLDSGDLPCNVNPDLPMPIRGLHTETYHTGKVVYHNDFSDTEWTALIPEGHMNLENILFAPLVLREETVGLVGLINKIGGFTEHDALMATAFGELAAVALRNSRTLESLKTALHEKEILLQEIHHRVKNNLAIVSSLLDLQAQFIDDEKAQQAFKESQNRIVSMARLHEHLYRSSDLSEIDMAHYIQNMVDHLQSFYKTTAVIITVDVAPDISLDIQTAIPCGLCINELVTNALKYAFPADDEERSQHNQIQVKLHANDTANYTLTVKDNGVGLPSDFDWDNAPSLGLQLVRIFSQQLGGTITLNNDTGTTFTLGFPKPNSQ